MAEKALEKAKNKENKQYQPLKMVKGISSRPKAQENTQTALNAANNAIQKAQKLTMMHLLLRNKARLLKQRLMNGGSS